MEIWKDIKGYEGMYQISNFGNVRSLPRTQRNQNGRVVKHKGKELSPLPNSRGYLRVNLKGDANKRYFVHRLVAIHFVANQEPEKYTVVHHLDSNPLNNKATNLKWTTIEGNNHYAIADGRMKRTHAWLSNLRKSNEKNGKSVIGENIQTGETITFVCLNDCRTLGFQPSCVCDCCNGKRKSHKGYWWKYAK